MKAILLFVITLLYSIDVLAQTVVVIDCDPIPEKKPKVSIIIRKSLDDDDMKEKAAVFSATFPNSQSPNFQVDAAVGLKLTKDRKAFQGMPIAEWHRNTGIEKPQDALLIGSNFTWELNRKKRIESIESLKSITTCKIQITPRFSLDGIEKLSAYELSAFWSPKRYVAIDTTKPFSTIVRDPKTNKKLKNVNGTDSLIIFFPQNSKFLQPNHEHQFRKYDGSCKKYVFSSYWSPQVGIEYQNRFQAGDPKAAALGTLFMIVFKVNWSLKLNDISKSGITRPIVEFTLDYQNRAADLANSTKTIKAGMKHFLNIGLDYILFQKDDETKTSIGISYTKGQDPTKFLAGQDFFQLAFKVKLN